MEKPKTQDGGVNGGTIEFQKVSPEEALKAGSPAEHAKALDAKFVIPQEQGGKNDADHARIQEIKQVLEVPQTKVVVEKGTETLLEQSILKPETPKKKISLDKLREEYIHSGTYEGRMHGQGDEVYLEEGLRRESADILNKAIGASPAVIGGTFLGAVGLLAANSAAGTLGVSLLGGVQSLISGASLSMAGGASLGLGVASVIGPPVAVGGALYLGYQGLRGIRNWYNKKRLLKNDKGGPQAEPQAA